MAKVEVTDEHGTTRLVPGHWVDSESPGIAGKFTLTERQAKALEAERPPTRSATIAQMRDYAARNGIDLGDATLKDDIFDVITDHVSNNGDAGNDGTGIEGA